MHKADYYVAMYNDKLGDMGDRSALNFMFTQFLGECGETIRARNCRTPSSFMGVIREFDEKWRAIANRLNFNRDGFLYWVKTNMPLVYAHFLTTYHRKPIYESPIQADNI